MNHEGTWRGATAAERNAPNILTADNADEADKGKRIAEGIREIRVIRGQWIEQDRRSLRAFSELAIHTNVPTELDFAENGPPGPFMEIGRNGWAQKERTGRSVLLQAFSKRPNSKGRLVSGLRPSVGAANRRQAGSYNPLSLLKSI